MGYYDNPVDEPTKYGFIETVVTGDLSYRDYSFNMFAVLRGEDGYYVSTDSGCSCPSPWESHTRQDFTGPLTAEQVKQEVKSLRKHAYDRVPKAEIKAALEKVV